MWNFYRAQVNGRIRFAHTKLSVTNDKVITDIKRFFSCQLNTQVQVLSEKNAELDRRIQQLKDERDGLNAALDEASDRIMVLEHRLRENELQVRCVAAHTLFCCETHTR